MRIPLNWSVFAFAFLSLVLTPQANIGKKQNEGEALQFLDKVRQLSDIRAVGSPPFRLIARVEATPIEGKIQPFVGSLVLTWLSPSQWREEVNFPGYNQVRVASEGKLWTARSVPYEPLRAYQLGQLVDFRSAWTLRSGESVRGPKDRKYKQAQMQCAEVTTDHGGRELCADAASFVPLRIQPLRGDSLLPPSDDYGDFVAWGGRQFPGLMYAYEGTAAVLEVRAQVEAAPSADPSLLTPPARAVEWDWCDNVMPPKGLSSVPPHYPDAERQGLQNGTVSVYAVIGTDGSPQNLAVVRSAGRDFDAATLTSVRQWRYRPAMCGNSPITTETVIDVSYKISN